ncbi:TcpE family conjugal transfer membrane protein [Nocardiopsis sp. RSe5-2]|uniref:TcpE family conjugal transfer membrane protein n=1 Tax=Nocardiopsis endophytica TaxID=3018445 RepID=A0ABT4TZB3_9ACTN|nr:TcpE family conjugal transfer membrane protein [Nocardiopsis endophytica]MDA2809442.1 TcpE family conjugal transfer membrane protein [Nocardiopsis endophytica]
MDLPTYTNIWRIEKRLYKLYDFRLPQPLSVVTLGVFLGVLAVWTLLMSLLNVPLRTPWHVLWIVPPLIITFLATRPVIEGKRLTELLLSQIRFLAEARVYTRLAPEHEPAEVRVEVRVWHRDPDLPLPDVSKSRKAKGAAKRRGGLREPAVGAAGPEPLRLAPAPEEAEVTGLPAQTVQEEAPGERVAAVAAPERSRGKRAPEPLNLDRDRPAPEPLSWAASDAVRPTVRPTARPPEPEEEPQEALHKAPHQAPHEAPVPESGEEPAEVPTARVPDRPKGRPEREAGAARAAEPGVVDEAPEPEPLPEAPEPEPLPAEPVRSQPPRLAFPEPDRVEPAAAPARTRDRARDRATAASAGPAPAPKRGLGVKVLNYFGFALNKAQPQEPREASEDAFEQEAEGSLTRPTSLERGEAADRARERDELRRENEEWLNAYRSSGASAADPEEQFDEVYDPGGRENAAAAGEAGNRPDKQARRRAEEMMAAPAPEEPHAAPPVDEGVRVIEPAPGTAEEAVSAEGVADLPVERDESAHRRLRGRIQGKQVERRLARERERVEPLLPRLQAQATGAPATPEEAAQQAVGETDEERGRRPHAAPWELPGHGGQKRAEDRTRDGAEAAPQAESAAQAEAAPQKGEASQKGAASAKSAQEERLEVLDRHLERLEEQERAADPVPPQPRFAESEDIERTKRRREGWFTEERAERPVQDEVRKAEAPTEPVPAEPVSEAAAAESAESAPAEAGVPEAPSPEAGPKKSHKPGLQLDHGTGEHESFTATAEGPRDAEESAKPVRDAASEPVPNATPKPATELDHGTGEHESYAATAGADDASPEAAFDAAPEAAAAGTRAEAPSKPGTELDHGTGEHESYAATAGPSVDEHGAKGARSSDRSSEPPRPSAEEHAPTDAATDAATEQEPKAASEDDADARPEQGEEAAPEPSKPVMQLDHGTGEHESYGYAAAPPWPGVADRSEASAAHASEHGHDSVVFVDTGSSEAEAGAPEERAASTAPSTPSASSAPSTPSAQSEGRPSDESTAQEGVATASEAPESSDGQAAQAAEGGRSGAGAGAAEAPVGEAAVFEASERAESPAARAAESGRPEAGSGATDDRVRDLPESAGGHAAANAPADGAATSQPSESSEGQAAQAAEDGQSGAESKAGSPEEDSKAGDLPESAAARPVADASVGGAAASGALDSADGSDAHAAGAVGAGTPSAEPEAPGTPKASEEQDGEVRSLAESAGARSAPDAREADVPVDEANADEATADEAAAEDQASSAADATGESNSDGADAAPAVSHGAVSETATAVGSDRAEPAEAGKNEDGVAEAPAPKAAESPEPAKPTPAPSPAPPSPAPVKPVTELDHGTGEHESYAATARPDEEPHRATDDDLTAAEEAALRARQTASRRPAQESAARAESSPSSRRSPSPESNDILERSRRLSRSMRSNPTGSQRAVPHEPKHTSRGTDRDTGRSTDSRAADPAESPAERSAEHSAGRSAETRQAPESGTAQPGDGVFSKVAENARRLNNLFGQDGDRGKGASEPGTGSGEVVELAPDGSGTGTASDPDSDDKPELQLDHGTGEQRRLSPADRARAAAEAAGTDTGATRGWRRLARVVTGGSNAPKHELPAGDVARLRMDIGGPRSVVVLGCTGGAGQTITSLMLGHTLASYRDERIVAVDVNPGVNGLSRRISSETPETLTSLLANAESVDGYADMRRYTTQTGTGLEVVSTLDDPYVQTLDDRDYAGLAELLSAHYEVALLDPAATGVARALPTADGLVLVAPASADAARSVAMTFEWLDGHGYAALRSRSVVVINGVSKRSLGDVDEAEQVARGRCRAIVRVPWDDHIAQGRLGDTGNLRSSTRRAHAALGGVLMHAVSPAGQQPPNNRAPSEARR